VAAAEEAQATAEAVAAQVAVTVVVAAMRTAQFTLAEQAEPWAKQAQAHRRTYTQAATVDAEAAVALVAAVAQAPTGLRVFA
jgi:hypothetical protein